MATRTPLRMWNGNIREMTSSEINSVIARMASKYHYDASILLDVDNGWNKFEYLPTTADYNGEIHIDFRNEYYTTGTAATNASNYPSETTTGEPVYQNNQYFNNSLWPKLEYQNNYGLSGFDTDTDNKRFPLFYNNGNLQCMSLTDVLDTFVYPAFEYIAGSPITPAEDQPGAYKIIGKSGSSGDGGEGVAPTTPSGFTRIGTVPIYRDWFADQVRYTDGTATATIGTSGTTQNYYEYVEYWLFRKNHSGTFSSFADSGTAIPLHMTPGANVEDHNLQEKDVDELVKVLKFYAHGEGGTGTRRLTYKIVDAATTSLDILGTIMNNSTTNSTGQAGTKYNLFVNANDYRAQEFPVGTIVVQDQYALVIDPNDTVH